MRLTRIFRSLVPALALVLAAPTLAASGKSQTYRNGLTNQFFRATTLTFPATLNVRLYSVCPDGIGGGGTELTGNGYAAQAYNPGTGNWTAASNGMTQNSVAITFPTVATAAWTVNCVALESGGTIYYWGNVTGSPITVNVGAQASFAINALQVTEASYLEMSPEERMAFAHGADGNIYAISLAFSAVRDAAAHRTEIHLGN